MRTTGRTADSDSGPPVSPHRAHRLPPRKGLEAVGSLTEGGEVSGEGGGGDGRGGVGGGVMFM